jgi:hypothetical protein
MRIVIKTVQDEWYAEFTGCEEHSRGIEKISGTNNDYFHLFFCQDLFYLAHPVFKYQRKERPYGKPCQNFHHLPNHLVVRGEMEIPGRQPGQAMFKIMVEI